MTKDLVKVNEQARDLREFLNGDKVKGSLAQAVPKWLSPDRLVKVIFSATLRNPALLECTKESILQSVMMCAQLGLEPILGRAYLIPYNNRKNVNGQWVSVKECQMQPGYQGLIDLAKRSGEIADVYAEVVFEKDEAEIQFGTERRIHHVPYLAGDPGAPIWAYAVWFMKDGTQHPAVMRLHDIYKRRDQSQGYQYAKSKGGKTLSDNPWTKWPDEMIRKTVIKWSSKQVPAAIDFMEAVALDDATETGAQYVSPFMEQLPAPPTPTAFDMARDFDGMAALKYSGGALEKFNAWIESTAEKNGVTVEVAKAEIVRTDDFENAAAAFDRTIHVGRRHTDEETRQFTGNQDRGSAPPEINGNRKTENVGSLSPEIGNQKTEKSPDVSGGGNQDKTESEKEPGSVELPKDHPFFRAKWIRMKKGSRKLQTGLWSHVDLHAALLGEVPMDLFTELARKFQAIYGRSFPYSPDGELIERNAKFGHGESGGASSPEEVVSQAGSSGPADVNQGQGEGDPDTTPDSGAEGDESGHLDGETEDQMIEGFQRLMKIKEKYPAAWAQAYEGTSEPTNIGEINDLIRRVTEVAEFTGEKF